ncbi:MAG: CorA family divalent cation transporter, partial [Candidatus Micrarchaeota archaeon]
MDVLLLKGMKALHGPSLVALKKERKKRERIWVDLNERESDVLQEFGITRALFRAMNRSELPLYREFNGIVCLLAFNLRLNNNLAKERLHIYVTKEFVVTVNCRRYMDAFRQLGKESATPEDVMCFILLEVSEDNERVVEAVEDKIDGVEEKLIRRHEIHVEGLLALKRTILAINKVFWHERDMLFYLRHCTALEFGSEARVELDEAHNSLLYCIDLNGTFREILTDSLDVYHTVLSTKINFAIKKLTVVTVILAIV